MTPLLPGGEIANWRRKIFAGFVVALMVLGAQWYINFRTRPPEPQVEFPKDVENFIH